MEHSLISRLWWDRIIRLLVLIRMQSKFILSSLFFFTLTFFYTHIHTYTHTHTHTQHTLYVPSLSCCSNLKSCDTPWLLVSMTPNSHFLFLSFVLSFLRGCTYSIFPPCSTYFLNVCGTSATQCPDDAGDPPVTQGTAVQTVQSGGCYVLGVRLFWSLFCCCCVIIIVMLLYCCIYLLIYVFDSRAHFDFKKIPAVIEKIQHKTH
jgi:hypothetical protein